MVRGQSDFGPRATAVCFLVYFNVASHSAPELYTKRAVATGFPSVCPPHADVVHGQAYGVEFFSDLIDYKDKADAAPGHQI